MTGNLIAPSGTVLLFRSATPPVGWVQQSGDLNDRMLRLVDPTSTNPSDAGGIVSGSDSPSSFSGDHTHATSNHSLSITEIPLHRHGYKDRYYAEIASNVSGAGFKETMSFNYNAKLGSGNTDADNDTFLYIDADTDLTGGSTGHNHGDTASDGVTFTPRYANIISAVKS